MGLTALLQPPVTVRLIEPKNDPTNGLAEVLLTSLGLTGVLVALLAGAVFAGILFFVRSRSE